MRKPMLDQSHTMSGVMNYLNNLLLLVMFSALASTAQASHAAAVDGYLDQASSHFSVLSQSELESDPPEHITNDSCLTCVLPPSSARFVVVETVLPPANYQDFHARAPPHS